MDTREKSRARMVYRETRRIIFRQPSLFFPPAARTESSNLEARPVFVLLTPSHVPLPPPHTRANARPPRYHVSEGTLRCLSALPLRIREDERARAKARVKSKNRKRRREGSVDAGLMEADARVDEDVRAKCQADALHEVFYRQNGTGGEEGLLS